MNNRNILNSMLNFRRIKQFSPVKLNLVGLGLFSLICGYAVYISPPNVFEVNIIWAIPLILSAFTLLASQAVQTAIFCRVESLEVPVIWSVWFAAEKAWLNAVAPAKAGTVSAVLLLQKKYAIHWNRYVRFMLYIAANTFVLSLILLVLVLVDFGVLMGLSLSALFFTILALKRVYQVSIFEFVLTSLSLTVQLICLSSGVAFGMLGLDYKIDLNDIAFIGALLNLLSIVSLTPGNFGVREALLAAFSQFTNLDLYEIVQASTVFVFVRLMISLVTATALRGIALRAITSVGRDCP